MMIGTDKDKNTIVTLKPGEYANLLANGQLVKRITASDGQHEITVKHDLLPAADVRVTQEIRITGPDGTIMHRHMSYVTLDEAVKRAGGLLGVSEEDVRTALLNRLPITDTSTFESGFITTVTWRKASAGQ